MSAQTYGVLLLNVEFKVDDSRSCVNDSKLIYWALSQPSISQVVDVLPLTPSTSLSNVRY